MKKLLITSATVLALLIEGNNTVQVAVEQIDTLPKNAETAKKISIKETQNSVLTGNYDPETNLVSWEIKLNPNKEKFTGDLKLENLIPVGLVLDPDTIEVIKNDDFIQNSSVIKLKQNKLTAVFPAEKYSGSTILIKYQTKVKAEPTESNYLRVSQAFKFGDDQTKEYEQDVKYDHENKDFIIEPPRKEASQDDRQISFKPKSKTDETHNEDWFKRLAELIVGKKETTSDKGGEKTQEQVKNQKQQPSLENTDLSRTPTVKGLTGFDTKTTEVKTKAQPVSATVKFDSDEDENDEKDSIVSPKSEPHPNKHHLLSNEKTDTSKIGAKLPQAGESAGIILSLVGILSLAIGKLIRTKFLN